MNTALLTNQKCSTDKFAQQLNALLKDNPETKFEDVQQLLTTDFGFLFEGDVKQNPMVLKPVELEALQKAFDEKKLPQTARRILGEKAGVSWTTGSHSALPVLTTSSGVGAEKFTGFLDNTDISKLMKELLQGP